jgi:hypothetical protein
VGIDAATGREIPRSYVDWLEKRVKHLEFELKLQQPNASDGEDATIDPQLQSGWSEDGRQSTTRRSISESTGTMMADVDGAKDYHTPRDDRNDSSSSSSGENRALHLRPDIENLVNQVGLVGVQGTSAPGFMGGSSGISCVLSTWCAGRAS